jgi:hypothetical protein
MIIICLSVSATHLQIPRFGNGFAKTQATAHSTLVHTKPLVWVKDINTWRDVPRRIVKRRLRMDGGGGNARSQGHCNYDLVQIVHKYPRKLIKNTEISRKYAFAENNALITPNSRLNRNHPFILHL